MISPRNTRSPLWWIIVTFGTFVGFLYWRNSLPSSVGSWASSNGVTAANATLGFGALYAVSGPGSPRRSKLEQAAAVTQIQLTIPDLPAWTDEDVNGFKADENSTALTGSIKAWLSHHHVLKEFLASGVESAVIFEDDIDWDIRLRSQQAPLAQKAAQQLAETMNLDTYEYPWGVPDRDWDLYYLGHCGDYFNDLADGIGIGHHHPSDLEGIPHVAYADSSMSLPTDLHPFTASMLVAFDVPPQTRILHKSQWPLCTFGYAITRRAADRIINEIAPAKENANTGVTAFDIAMLHGCRNGYLDKCYSLQPELFHHMEGDSLIAEIDSADHKIFRPPVDARGLEQVIYRKETSNIDCGFFSGDFYYGSDASRLAFLQEEVGRKGRCLKPGKDASIPPLAKPPRE
ncbi:glycosyltransferase family 25 protein [Polychaeton citri CBS 116435]|uniref:Glycosyltransferase family 25 protein n=1 Tax=Polychaeton citri CBS 116435 TaxID=1314669 RepID=A0A9P4UQ47_9PEZI|nr:glycosyltransferase family 25 protein [Polychaeton citri CBS 116435]